MWVASADFLMAWERRVDWSWTTRNGVDLFENICLNLQKWRLGGFARVLKQNSIVLRIGCYGGPTSFQCELPYVLYELSLYSFSKTLTLDLFCIIQCSWGLNKVLTFNRNKKNSFALAKSYSSELIKLEGHKIYRTLV